MNDLLVLFLIIVVLVIVIVGIVMTQVKHINAVNEAINEYIGGDPTIPSDVRAALQPLQFQKLADNPIQYAYSYQLKSSMTRRTLFVGVSKGSEVFVNGAKLSDVINETPRRTIYVGLIDASPDTVKLIVTSPNDKQPVMYIA